MAIEKNISKDKVIIKKQMIFDGIPFSIYYQDDKKPKPLIFFFHGFGSNRITGIGDRGDILASKGFYVIAIDAYLHGEREAEFYSKLSSFDKQKEIINITMRTAKDAKHLYDKYFKNWNDILKYKVYAYGVSMGAAVTFYLGTIMDELKTIVSIVGSPSFYQFYQAKKITYKWEDDYYYNANLNSYKVECPLLNYQRLANKNIFMANGDKDTVVPLKYAKELYKKLSSNNVLFKTYDTAHCSTELMLKEAYQFLLNN